MTGPLTTLMRLLARVPLRWLHAFGSLLGWLVFVASPRYRLRFRRLSWRAGVPWSRARPAVAAAGRMLAELPPLWARPFGTPLPMPVHWEGGELIEQAHAAGRGVVLMTPHLGCFEVLAQSYAERYGPRCGPMTALYRPASKPWLEPLVEQARRRPHLEPAPATLAGVRQMLRALKRGGVVGLLPDQVPAEGQGVWAPFFDRPAYTMTLAARLAQQTGAEALIFWGERLARGAGYRVRVAPLGETLPDDPVGAATAINRAMERLILQCPGQYLWGYSRHKPPRREAARAGEGRA